MCSSSSPRLQSSHEMYDDISGGGAAADNARCGRTIGLVWNLTSSYANQSNEASMVSASLFMFLLAALFFNLNLCSGLSDGSAVLDPKIRVVLSKALSLFLIVMSYLFSEAKNAGGGLVSAGSGLVSAGSGPPELPLRARLILTWMLVVELLRNKVEEIRMQGLHTGSVERAGRVAWLGSLVFFNLRGAGRKSVFGILWLLCAAKLLQRVTFTVMGKRSFAYGKNARVIISYMARMLARRNHAGAGTDADADVCSSFRRGHGHGGVTLMKRCEYVVMGEDRLVIEATPAGYSLADVDTNVTTVGKIWRLSVAAEPESPESDPFFASLDHDGRLRRLCLSMALFKLLRRSFEHLPAMSEAETRDCQDLIFNGLLQHDNNGGGQDHKAAAEALFQVMNDETIFLSEYYHSVVPVVLASPSFLLANYLVLPAMVLVVCLVLVVLCGNGDVLFAFRSIRSDNYSMSFGMIGMARCLLGRVTTSPSVFFTTIDFSITLLLFLVLVYEQVWEFVVFLFSNWFMVSLLHEYAANLRHWRGSGGAAFRWAIRRILWVRSKMINADYLRVRQLSALRSSRFSLSLMLPTTVSLTLPFLLPTVLVPKEVKHSIVNYLLETVHAGGAGALSNGKLAVAEHRELRWACESESVAEVILTWHIATCLFAEMCPPDPEEEEEETASRNTAATLSKYCAYLVAFHPELLPDNTENSERVFEAMEEELKATLGFWGYYLPLPAAILGGGGIRKIMDLADKLGKLLGMVEMTVVHKGASLGCALGEKAAAASRRAGDGRRSGEVMCWKVLADLWVQLVVYAALSGDEECVMGHAKLLPEGAEFLTVLWALATHTGLSRRCPSTPPPVAVPMEHV